MDKTSNQLETVFQGVIEYFADIPDITVTPGDGTPPELYTITFNRSGLCREDGGEVYPCSTHVISISIPFGFPQFPPACQPESPTFHPDFDSAAICIEDAWEADQSITELILHIGRMFSGEIYSRTNAFNEEAAEWYKKHSDRLPCSKAESQEATSSEPDAGEMELELAEEENDLQQDMVLEPIMETEGLEIEESSSFTIDALDDEEFEKSFSLEGSTQHDTKRIDPDFLRLMAKQKRFHAVSKELQQYDDPFEGRTALAEETQSALNKVTTLFQEANDLEHQGKQRETLEKLNAIEALVVDAPLLGKSKRRVQQALDLLGDWVVEQQNGEAATAASSKASQGKADSASSPRAYRDDRGSENITKILLALGGCTLLLGLIAVASWFFFSSNLKKAESRYAECRQLLDLNDFRAAEQKCEEALNLADNVYVFKQDEKKRLSKKSRTLLDSPKLQQGLAGNILLDGKYVPQADRELLLKLKKLLKEGDSFFTDKHWDGAARSYSQALALTREIGSISPETIADLRENILRTDIYTAIKKGKEAFAASQWNTAISQYKKATRLLSENDSRLQGINVKQTAEKLERIMLRAVIIRDRQKVARDIQAQRYGSANSGLLRIQQAISSSPFADQAEFQTILQELSLQLAETEKQLFIEKQANYLTNNYKSLFLKHYPSANRSKLSRPRVEFLRKIGDRLLFKMQCTETTGGRPLRLEMNYLYSPASGKWRFYSDQ